MPAEHPQSAAWTPEMLDRSAIAARIKAARTARRMSVAQWSALLGGAESISRITDVERGKQRVPPSMLRAVVQHANVSPLWLLTGRGEMLCPEYVQAGPNAELAGDLLELLAGGLSKKAKPHFKLYSDGRIQPLRTKGVTS